jgi:hypothetical protein
VTQGLGDRYGGSLRAGFNEDGVLSDAAARLRIAASGAQGQAAQCRWMQSTYGVMIGKTWDTPVPPPCPPGALTAL